MTVIKLSAVIVSLLLFTVSVDAKTLEIPAIQTVPIKDSATGRDYELYIKLPESYDAKSDKSHPVIYIADARWHIEIISGSIDYLIKDAILVGVSWERGAQIQDSRARDYSPIEYKKATFPTGKADKHLNFFRHDVFQYMESKYNADPNQRSYFGYSMSGTFGAYILFTQPNTFKNYILGSPATLFGGHFVHNYESILQAIPESLDANVFVSVGSDEKQKNIEHAISLVKFLKSRKTNKSHVELKVIESANHGSAFPITAVRSLYWLANIFNE